MSTAAPISLSTHVLDTAHGAPVEGVPVVLERRGTAAGEWFVVGAGQTDADGRIGELVPAGEVLPGGVYRVTFDLEASPAVTESWYPEISIVVTLQEGGGHSHVPLLLAPYGYSTYRGS